MPRQHWRGMAGNPAERGNTIMMDLGTIRDMNRSASNHAKRFARRPFVPAASQRAELTMANLHQKIHIPAMGDYVPKGWETVGEPLFCDKSGCGSESEPAITLRRLVEI